MTRRWALMWLSTGLVNLAGTGPAGSQLNEPFPGTLEMFDLLAPSGDTSTAARFLFTLGDNTSVAGVGDLNNDGFDDVAVSSPGFFNTSSLFPLGFGGNGRVIIHFGGPGPYPDEVQPGFLDGLGAFLIHRPNATDSDQFGWCVAGVGDVNHDGIDDLAISEYSSSGSTYVIFGKDTAGGNPFPSTLSVDDLDGSNGFVLAVRSSSVASAGDLNGDGIDDLAIAEIGFGGTKGLVLFGRDSASGQVFPATVSAGDLDGVSGFVIDPLGGIDSISGAGDINADGIADLIAGSGTVREKPSSTFRGGAYVIFGRDHTAGNAFPAIIGDAFFDGENGFILLGGSFGQSDFVGQAVSSAGDLNNDDIDDVAIGSDILQSFVLFGRDAGAGLGFPPSIRLDHLDGSDGFQILSAGFSLAGVGDVNSDGRDDLLVGERNFPDSFRGAGVLIFGRDSTNGLGFPPVLDVADPSLADGNATTRLINGDSSGEFGFSVSSAGDFNGDSVSDLIIADRECCLVAVVLGRATAPCPADTNNDGTLSPADFSAWIAAFNAFAPECDQNGDGSCTPADFSAWIANFNAGC